jgi:hypothetical protein
MINGAHLIVFTDAPDQTRTFLRDHLHLSNVDAGDGWLIFGLPPAELAVHPADEPRQELYLMTPDLGATIVELTAAGATFGPVESRSWGRIAPMTMPGGARLSIYQPSHPRPNAIG